MQTFVVRALRLITTIIWVFFLVLFVFVEGVIVLKAVTGDFFHRDIEVHLRSVEALPSFTSDSGIVRFNGVAGADAKLQLLMKATPLTTSFVLIGFTAIAFAILAVVFQVRKILRSIRKNEPFDHKNIRRLRIISLCLLAIAVLGFLSSLFNRHLLTKYAGDASSHYIGKMEIGLTPVIMAMVVFVLSEIFRQGYTLKTENEAFV